MQNTNNSDSAKTQKKLASQMGMSVDTLENYKMLADMIPEHYEWIFWHSFHKNKIFYCRNPSDMVIFWCGDEFLGTGDRFLKGNLLPFLMENRKVLQYVYNKEQVIYLE